MVCSFVSTLRLFILLLLCIFRLYVSEGSVASANSNTNDSSRLSETRNLTDLDVDKYNLKKNVDTRTFTRPKKRIIRPTLESISDNCSDFNLTKSKFCNNQSEIHDIEQIKIPENPFNNLSLRKDVSISTGPLHFKLSDPVLNHSFDKILLTASDGYDSFQNMSPPSLMNSLCSSSFMDSSLIQNTSNSILNSDISSKSNISDEKSETNYVSIQVSQESMRDFLSPLKTSYEDTRSVKSNKLDSTVVISSPDKQCAPNEKLDHNQTPENDQNMSFKSDITSNLAPINKIIISTESPKLNTTFGKEIKEKSPLYQKNNDNLNTTYNTFNKSKSNEKSLNTTYVQIHKTDSENSLNSTFTKDNKKNSLIKKPRNITNLPESFKLSCPDINKTFQASMEKSLNRTFQKLSDSQPNLSKEEQKSVLKPTIELRNTNLYEGYRSSKCGSTDSLDEKSSSVSDSSKESTSKPLNMGDLDNLARLQEQSKYSIILITITTNLV